MFKAFYNIFLGNNILPLSKYCNVLIREDAPNLPYLVKIDHRQPP